MVDNTQQCCYCGHERGMHWTGRGCAGDMPYIPQLYGSPGRCECTRFDYWPKGDD